MGNYSQIYSRLHSVDGVGGLAHFTALAGAEYGGRAVRLLVIGRAANGWTQLPVGSAREFGEAAEAAFRTSGFSWVGCENGRLYSLHGAGRRYWLSRSAFWRAARRVLYGLDGGRLPERWVERIAWSNLYKLSPLGAGNPSSRLCAAQIEPCRELLREEMLALRPTHILMPVGLGWFRGDGRYDFSRLFEAVTPGAGAVEATARFRLPDGTAAPALITCRPEFRNEDGFARDVLEAFRDS